MGAESFPLFSLMMMLMKKMMTSTTKNVKENKLRETEMNRISILVNLKTLCINDLLGLKKWRKKIHSHSFTFCKF